MEACIDVESIRFARLHAVLRLLCEISKKKFKSFLKKSLFNNFYFIFVGNPVLTAIPNFPVKFQNKIETFVKNNVFNKFFSSFVGTLAPIVTYW
jgi:hypothetical protein